MIGRSSVANCLGDVRDELLASGKSKTAVFFEDCAQKIVVAKDNDELEEVLEIVCSSGAIIQYANFSFKEERVFKVCLAEAEKLLALMKSKTK